MKKPCLVDFKLGCKPYPHHSEEKKKKYLYKVKHSTSG